MFYPGDVCCLCDADLSSGVDSFLAPVGDKDEFKQFCSENCMEQYLIMISDPSDDNKDGTNKEMEMINLHLFHKDIWDPCIVECRYRGTFQSIYQKAAKHFKLKLGSFKLFYSRDYLAPSATPADFELMDEDTIAVTELDDENIPPVKKSEDILRDEYSERNVENLPPSSPTTKNDGVAKESSGDEKKDVTTAEINSKGTSKAQEGEESSKAQQE